MLLFSLPPVVRQRVIALLVGVTGALVAAQVFQVHIFTLMVIVWAVFGRVTSRTWTPRGVVLPLVSATLLASTALYGELVNSPTLGLQLIALTVSAAVIVLYGNQRDISMMLYGILAVTSASSVWALLQVIGIVPIQTWHLDVSSIGRPLGFYPEPDWLGMFSGIGVVLAWRLPLRRWVRVILIVANLSAWVLAFARAAWIALAASAALAFVVYLLTREPQAKNVKRVRSGRVVAVALAGAAGLVAFETIPRLHDDLTERLSRTLTVQADDISARARVLQIDGLNHLALSAPWNGWGVSSSGRVGVSGILNLSGPATNNLGSNWVIAMWVDGAWLSLPIILVLVGAALFSLRTIQSNLLVLVLLASLFSNATYQPITWLLVGACLWSAKERREQRPSRSGGTRRRLRRSYQVAN
jgi:uncharacterized membrane protein YsdA (DUF1294 family)